MLASSFWVRFSTKTKTKEHRAIRHHQPDGVDGGGGGGRQMAARDAVAPGRAAALAVGGWWVVGGGWWGGGVLSRWCNYVRAKCMHKDPTTSAMLMKRVAAFHVWPVCSSPLLYPPPPPPPPTTPPQPLRAHSSHRWCERSKVETNKDGFKFSKKRLVQGKNGVFCLFFYCCGEKKRNSFICSGGIGRWRDVKQKA